MRLGIACSRRVGTRLRPRLLVAARGVGLWEGVTTRARVVWGAAHRIVGLRSAAVIAWCFCIKRRGRCQGKNRQVQGADEATLPPRTLITPIGRRGWLTVAAVEAPLVARPSVSTASNPLPLRDGWLNLNLHDGGQCPKSSMAVGDASHLPAINVVVLLDKGTVSFRL